jgi:hypothetical protein
MTIPVRTYIDELRALARSTDLNQVILVERLIEEYLKANGDHLASALERLRSDIHEEEMAGRDGEDWSIARDYVRRLLHTFSLLFQPKKRLDTKE